MSTVAKKSQTIQLPEGVETCVSDRTGRRIFLSPDAKRRMQLYEDYRTKMAQIALLRQQERRQREVADQKAVDEAKNETELVNMILAQLARQENTLLQLPEKDRVSLHEWNKMRSETMEALHTVL